MNVVVFSGTTEGRELSRQLAALGIEVTVSVATPLGQEEQGSTPGVTVRCGRLLPDEMAALLGDAALCIDATHPYAVEVTKNIKAAAEQAGVESLRLLRPASPLPENCLVFESAKQAAEALAAKEGNLLLATGAKELAQFAAIPPERLYPRVLPTLESITACEAANIPHRNIIAMQGPFSFALNQAMMEQFHIRWLVTKDGGAAGGFDEKAAAASAASWAQRVAGSSLPPVRKKVGLPCIHSATGSQVRPWAETRFHPCHGRPSAAASSWMLERPGSTRARTPRASSFSIMEDAPE